MRRALDRRAVDSIATGKEAPRARAASCLKKPPSPHEAISYDGKARSRRFRRVSFSEIDDDALYEEKTPPRSSRDLKRAVPSSPLLERRDIPGCRDRREDQARRNLQRIVANSQQLSGKCSWTVLCDWRTSLSHVVQSWMSDGSQRLHHASIVADVMLIGKEPGSADDALLLRQASVSVDGVIVAIKSPGMPAVFQTLQSEKEAAAWAEKVRAAALVWQQCCQQSEEACGIQQQQMEAERRAVDEKCNADSGGTPSPPSFYRGGCRYRAPSIERCTHNVKSDKPELQSRPQKWVRVSTNISGDGDPLVLSHCGKIETSWTWLLAFFRGSSSVTLA